jgi:hypothetical protein
MKYKLIIVGILFIYRPRIHANHLNEAEITCARQQRLKEIHLWLLIQEILIYMFFFHFVLLLTPIEIRIHFIKLIIYEIFFKYKTN